MDKPLTERSRAAMSEAQGQALDRNNPTLEPEHLLLALLDAGRRPRPLDRAKNRPRALGTEGDRRAGPDQPPDGA